MIEVRRRRNLKQAFSIFLLAALLLLITGCGGYGGGSGAKQPNPTPQIGQASAILTLTVQ